MEKIVSILEKIGIPFAYDHFAEGEAPDPPFLCYLDYSSDNFSADGLVYFKIDEIHIEIYTNYKDTEIEKRIEDALDEASIFYDKSETWIDSEKLYEVLYIFELEV